MSDNLFAILVLFILVIVLVWLTFKIYQLNKNFKSSPFKTSELNMFLGKIDYIDGFDYFLDKQPITYEDFEKEQLFLLEYFERNSESLKQLADCYEQIEIYIDFKLSSIPDFKQKSLIAFYKSRYQVTKEAVAKKFEEKLNHLLASKMAYSPYVDEGTIKPRGIKNKCLAVQLFKLKSK